MLVADCSLLGFLINHPYAVVVLSGHFLTTCFQVTPSPRIVWACNYQSALRRSDSRNLLFRHRCHPQLLNSSTPQLSLSSIFLERSVQLSHYPPIWLESTEEAGLCQLTRYNPTPTPKSTHPLSSTWRRHPSIPSSSFGTFPCPTVGSSLNN
jgi:hypothetical protein